MRFYSINQTIPLSLVQAPSSLLFDDGATKGYAATVIFSVLSTSASNASGIS